MISRNVLSPVLASIFLGLVVAACGGASEGADEGQSAALEDDSVSPDKDAGKSVDSGTKLTWTSIYDEAFAPGTPGHCGNSGCHSVSKAGFACGKTAATCLAGMVKKGLLSKTNPKASTLGSTTSSPLRWVHTGGVMPADNKTAEPKLGADIEAWVKAGAPGIASAADEDETETATEN